MCRKTTRSGFIVVRNARHSARTVNPEFGTLQSHSRAQRGKCWYDQYELQGVPAGHPRSHAKHERRRHSQGKPRSGAKNRVSPNYPETSETASTPTSDLHGTLLRHDKHHTALNSFLNELPRKQTICGMLGYRKCHINSKEPLLSTQQNGLGMARSRSDDVAREQRQTAERGLVNKFNFSFRGNSKEMESHIKISSFA